MTGAWHVLEHVHSSGLNDDLDSGPFLPEPALCQFHGDQIPQWDTQLHQFALEGADDRILELVLKTKILALITQQPLGLPKSCPDIVQLKGYDVHGYA